MIARHRRQGIVLSVAGVGDGEAAQRGGAHVTWSAATIVLSFVSTVGIQRLERFARLSQMDGLLRA